MNITINTPENVIVDQWLDMEREAAYTTKMDAQLALYIRAGWSTEDALAILTNTESIPEYY